MFLQRSALMYIILHEQGKTDKRKARKYFNTVLHVN